MDIFKLFGRIAIDSSDATDELSRFTKQANNAGKKVGKALTDITKGAKTMGTALNKVGEQAEQTMRKIAGSMALATTAASAAAVTIGKSALDIRSSIEQGMGGADAVFQQYSKHIKESAQDAWKTAGLSMEEYLATANKMGSLFKGAGFTEMQAVEYTANAMQRAADVASIMGIDIGMAMESIAGMAKGNFTMMDNLGVAMNDTTLETYRLEKGMAKSVSTMTTAEKVGLAYEMFMERTADYAGNYAKENETAAGSLQTLTAAWENFLGGVGSFEDLENSAFGYLRIATKTMGLEDFLPLIDGAERTVEEVAEILSMEDLSGRQKFTKARRYLLDKSISLASAMGDHIVKGADNVSSVISETLSDINVNLPHYLEEGRKIFAAVRDGVKKAANELINTASIISPDVVSGWFDLKTDFITIGLNFLGGISQAISDDLKLGEESKVGKSLKDGLHNVVDAAAENLPKMTALATALIDGLADAILSTDEDGKTIDEKIEAMIDNILTELESWIEKGGPGKFTYAAGTFLGKFGEALILEAPRIFEGLMDGLISAFNGAITSVDEFFFGKKEPEVAVETSSNKASGTTTKKGIQAQEVAFAESESIDPLAKGLGTAAAAGILYKTVSSFATKHPVLTAIAAPLLTVKAMEDYVKSGQALKDAEWAKEATGGVFDAERLFVYQDENGEVVGSKDEMERLEAAKGLYSSDNNANFYAKSLDSLEAQMVALEENSGSMPKFEYEARMEALEEAYVATTQMLENELTENADTISEAAFEANQKVLEEAQSFITENLVSEAQAAETAAENGITELDTASSEAASSLNNFNAEIHEMRKYGGGVNNSVQFGDGSNGFPARVKDPMLSFFNFVPKIEEAADAVETVVRKALHPDLPPEYIEFLPKVEEVSESAAEEVETLGTQSENAAANVEQFGGTVSAVDKAVLALGLAAETAATKLHSIDTTTIYYMRNYGGGVNDSIQFGAETPGFASGLAFVPRDNLLARLHQGEAVLTAQEAYEWRQQKKMGSIEAAVAKLANAVAEMQEGFQANMNLYINKKHVASALSRDMGRSIGNREYTLLRGMGG